MAIDNGDLRLGNEIGDTRFMAIKIVVSLMGQFFTVGIIRVSFSLTFPVNETMMINIFSGWWFGTFFYFPQHMG